ncbi:beta-lactamase superfamily II metal-dependent hydrolase [Idiomarina loihiensis]|uniref:ComEC/Rec2 family competence protein n=1 Tax=Idiomarina TaxID=135575 RepID=UPI000313DF79|nr:MULTISPECIES: MBL fold metallo-hydrolase [Idiomarina]NWO03848.1 MBL fold metallo-hydrolase [Idiomarinaceae bacterium]PWW38514.1 beta-lactamase superfamily II metal-dependent hydrolase [Idiomarina loihiensis]TDP48412.1 beta-lactamase superfamily II metal-dependent hydrolase [Idiomarina loihiensis]TDS23578.1 beta-lactamase superfamily II metal-dependent hydrolase [Idiomarina sp. H2]
MSDFFEIDFLDVESKRSGDAIPLRYSVNGDTRIHVTDGGFQATGDSLVKHINKYYGLPRRIDAVIVTHPDGDHAGGLRKLFDEYEIGELWMLRPWLYSDKLIDRFSRFTSSDNLTKRLKELYPNLVALEELAQKHKVKISEPFQGAKIGDFNVLAPSKTRYLDLVVQSEKTPEATKVEEQNLAEAAGQYIRKAINFIRSAWGEEYFPEDDTSPENNMSVIQYACLCDQKILLTGDAGRSALDEAAEYAPYVGLQLPGIDRIQVPHHGSRHNVSTEILDRWLGTKHNAHPDSESFTAIVSAAKEDKDHPRKSVVRAFIHRGAKVISTEGSHKKTGYKAPEREGWVTVTPLPYPEDQEN